MSLLSKFSELAKEAGWKELPKCPFLLVGAHDRLYCAYDYESLRSELRVLGDQILDDIGLNQGYSSALERELIRRGCSVKECPRLSHQKRNVAGHQQRWWSNVLQNSAMMSSHANTNSLRIRAFQTAIFPSAVVREVFSNFLIRAKARRIFWRTHWRRVFGVPLCNLVFSSAQDLA